MKLCSSEGHYVYFWKIRKAHWKTSWTSWLFLLNYFFWLMYLLFLLLGSHEEEEKEVIIEPITFSLNRTRLETVPWSSTLWICCIVSLKSKSMRSLIRYLSKQLLQHTIQSQVMCTIMFATPKLSDSTDQQRTCFPWYNF